MKLNTCFALIALSFFIQSFSWAEENLVWDAGTVQLKLEKLAE